MQVDGQQWMRAAVRTGRRQVEVRQAPLPRLEPGTALVRVRAAGICGSDLHPYLQRQDADARPEGHEVAGEVVAVAPRPGEEPGVQEGDLVAVDTICFGTACGVCDWCRQGLPFHCRDKRRGDDWSGGFAEYLKRDLRGLFRLPPGMNAADGALVEPLAVAVHAYRVAGLRTGETVAVIGAGTIGLMAVLAAKAMGAGPLWVVARHRHQAELAEALGASAAVFGPAEAALAALDARTGGGRAGLVVEAVGGSAESLNQAWQLLERRGRVAVLGKFPQPVAVDLLTPLGREATVLFPVCYGEQDGRRDFALAIDLISTGKAPVSRLLTHRFPLERAAEAFATAADKGTGAIKVQLEP